MEKINALNDYRFYKTDCNGRSRLKKVQCIYCDKKQIK
jgi:hypothetical protein